MQEELLNKPYFFDKNDKFVKLLIKEQGFNCCREELPREHILWCLQNFSYGYAIIGKIISGKSSRGKSSSYLLKAYILFLANPISNIIEGRVLCSKECYRQYNYGVTLLDCVKQYGENSGFVRFDIQALPFEKLLKFYTNYGFIRGNNIHDRKGQIKVIEMSMQLIEIEQKYNLKNSSIHENEDEDEYESDIDDQV